MWSFDNYSIILDGNVDIKVPRVSIKPFRNIKKYE